jgi:fructosamine-3-kinase
MALAWTPLSFIVETDCLEAIQLIKDTTPNTSRYASRVQVIRELIRERDVKLAKVHRVANRVSHELARWSRVHGRTEAWVGNLPQEAAKAVLFDCNF